VSGALAERAFAEKLQRVGFTGLAIVERRPFGIDDCARYPLFDDELIALMRTLIHADQQGCVATCVTVTGHKPDV
jgi:arsenite methyltransferase